MEVDVAAMAFEGLGRLECAIVVLLLEPEWHTEVEGATRKEGQMNDDTS